MAIPTAVSVAYATKLSSESLSLLRDAGDMRDTLKSPYVIPGLKIIDIKMQRGKADTLLELCKQVEDAQMRSQIMAFLVRAQKKLAQAEQINKFLEKEDVNAVHPRVEQLIARLTRMKEKPLPSKIPLVNKAFEKLLKTRTQLDQIEGALRNPASFEALKKVRSMVGECDIELLQNYQNTIRSFGDNGSIVQTKYSHYYASHAAPKLSQILASAYFAMCYLGFVTKYADLRIKDIACVLHERPDESHQKMAHFLEEQGSASSPTQISIERLIEKFYKDKLTPVPLTSTERLEYAVDASAEEIQKKLQTLVDLKNAHQLSTMGAFIQIAARTFAIVFHSTGRISLYDACGCMYKGNLANFEANFGNTQYACRILHEITAKIGPKQPISSQPYCESVSFKTKSWITNNNSYAPLIVTLHPNHVVGDMERVASFPPIGNRMSGMPAMPVSFEVDLQEDDESAEEKTVSAHTVFELQRIIHLLSARSHEAYCQTLAYVHRLGSVAWPTGGTALDRVHFHLSKIQDKETPDKVDRTHANWGKTAFETEALSTPDQKLRALQRTQVELLLDRIRRKIQGTSDGDLLALLNALEGLQLNPRDLPMGQTNAALALFDKGLKKLNESRREHSIEDLPRDGQCPAAYSRNHFLNDDNSCDDSFRIKALAELESDFKTAWSI